MQKKLGFLSGLGMSMLPLAALAQVTIAGSTSIGCDLTTIGGYLCQIGRILNSVVPVLIALGVVYFVYGVVTYVIASDEEAKSTGRDRMIFGIIGMVAIVGMWGLVNVLKDTFGLNNTSNIQLPTVPVVIPAVPVRLR